MLKKMKLGSRMLLSIGTVALISFVITISYVTIKASNMSHQDAMDKAFEIAYRYSTNAQTELEEALNQTKSMAQVLKTLKVNNQVPDREYSNSIIKGFVQANPSFIGMCTCWEPDAFDGKDSEYVNKEGHDGTGRYIPYLYRSGNDINLEELVGYETPGDGDYYLVPKRNGKEMITTPYVYPVNGVDVLMTTLVTPISIDGKFCGVTTADISLGYLAEMISGIRAYETGTAALIASDGTYAANNDLEMIGKDIGNSVLWNQAKEAIKNGKEFCQIEYSSEIDDNIGRIIVPIHIGDTGTPWAFLVNIPMSKVMAKANDVFYSTVMLGAISVAILLTVVFFIARGISKPIEHVVKRLSESSQHVKSVSSQVTETSQSLAHGSNEQAAGLEEATSSLEEMSEMIKQNSENAQQANTLATEASHSAQSGNEAMTRMNSAIIDIQTSSDETAKIIKVIDEIAFQTNLLALNAAVEAARAGEAGKGFAVVAEEVRNLAMRSAEAAKDTSGMIEESVSNAQKGVEIAGEVAKVLEDIESGIMKTTQLVAEIAKASQEQNHGISQINTAVSNTEHITQRNAATAEESASTSEELSAQAEEMNRIIDELSAMVGAQSGNSTSLSASDMAFHNIAEGKSSHNKNMSFENDPFFETENKFNDFN